MRGFMEDDGRLPGIDDVELVGLVVGRVDGRPAMPETVLFTGAGNLDELRWIFKGGAK